MSNLLPNSCQTNDPNNDNMQMGNNLFPIGLESLRFPLDNSIQVLFTGHYNGFGVEVRSINEISFLYHMSCFGKGSASRSKPKLVQNICSPTIMRKRQFLKRNYWHKKFEHTEKIQTDSFFKDVSEFITKVVNDSKRQPNKEVIDLVSTDDEHTEEEESIDLNLDSNYANCNQQNMTVVVPNSDSEDDNYFSNIQPKSCINKVKIQEKLMLTLQEAFFLLYGLGYLQIINLDNKILSIEDSWKLFNNTDTNFTEKYVVYHYFRSKGYIVKPGIKFGGDYLLYKERPGVNHADYIVVIKYDNQNQEWLSILGHVRMANTTVKEVMIVEVNKVNKEDIKLPRDLNQFTVHEIILTRNLPLTINNDED